MNIAITEIVDLSSTKPVYEIDFTRSKEYELEEGNDITSSPDWRGKVPDWSNYIQSEIMETPEPNSAQTAGPIVFAPPRHKESMSWFQIPSLDFTADRIENDKITSGYERDYLENRYQALHELFEIHANDEFEPGYVSDFEIGLEKQFNLDPYLTIKFVGDLLREPGRLVAVLAEAIRAFGRIETATALEQRFRLLCVALKNRSPHIRDYAAAALSDLEDKRAIRVLKEAHENEPISVIRSSFKSAIDSLEAE